MAGAMRKFSEYLGLTDPEVEESYDYDDTDERTRVATEPVDEDEPVRAVETSPRESSPRQAQVTPLPRRTPVARVVQEPKVSEMNRITTIHPRTYNEAKDIGEAFREGVPVIMNLTEMDDGDAKRLVDFAAGLAFGLHGSIERVTNRVFLLSPSTVQVEGAAESSRSTQGLFNQS